MSDDLWHFTVDSEGLRLLASATSVSGTEKMFDPIKVKEERGTEVLGHDIDNLSRWNFS